MHEALGTVKFEVVFGEYCETVSNYLDGHVGLLIVYPARVTNKTSLVGRRKIPLFYNVIDADNASMVFSKGALKSLNLWKEYYSVKKK